MDQQVARVGEDEVGVHVRVDGLAVTEPGQDRGLGVAAGWMTDQLTLGPNLDVLGVGRGLEIFPKI